jgi:hypothetical protein
MDRVLKKRTKNEEVKKYLHDLISSLEELRAE